MLTTLLLPNAEKLQLLEEISLEMGKLILEVIATQESYDCPDCGIKSTRVHSQYQRQLADLPCVGKPVRIIWTVRRFFCDNPKCRRVTFVE